MLNRLKARFGPYRIVLVLALMAAAGGGVYWWMGHQPAPSDGPYVRLLGDELEAVWLCRGREHRERYSANELPLQISHCGMGAKLHGAPLQPRQLEFDGDFRVAAMSDFHGQYALLRQLLHNNGIVDSNDNWSFGNGHLVITGDVFDRGDQVTEILWLLYRLEQQALAAGGRLHLLLGNHEVMVLNGDLRYLNPKYQLVAQELGLEFQTLFAPDTVLGAWLRSKPVLARINDRLYLHGGLHPDMAREQRGLGEIDREFSRALVKSELSQPRSGWAQYLHGPLGPIWYRGYFKKEMASVEDLGLLMQHFGVRQFVVGHNSQQRIETRYDGRVVAIDASMKNGENGEVLFVEGDKLWRGNLAGQRLAVEEGDG